jgi:hypothetical protein
MADDISKGHGRVAVVGPQMANRITLAQTEFIARSSVFAGVFAMIAAFPLPSAKVWDGSTDTELWKVGQERSAANEAKAPCFVAGRS